MKGLLASLIFFALVGLGGVALVASNNWENPFSALTILTGTAAGGERPEGNFESERPKPPDRSAMAEGDRAEMSAGRGGAGEEGISLSWSLFGSVLYNIWYLFAAAAFIMVLSLPVQFIRRQFRNRKRTPREALAQT